MTRPRCARTGWVFLAILLGLAPAGALAKDICVRDSDGGSLVFSKVPTLRPGRAVALTGLRVGINPFRPVAPVNGGAVMRADGTVHIGLLVHGMSPSLTQVTSSTLIAVDASADFTGTGTIDGAGGFRPTATITFTRIDCDSATIP